MLSQKKDKESSNVELIRKKMLILTALEDKIKYLIKKVEELTDKTALTSDAPTMTGTYNVLVEQTRELLSIYFKVRSMGEGDSFLSQEMNTPTKEQVETLEKVNIKIGLALMFI